MDVISLHQRGIHNVVASLGTALTQQQGYLLRNNTEQIILSYDSDEAGQTAKVRAMEILQNMGCDIRILQMEGAKDPDEFIIKYGNARFQNVIDKAISVVEFKVKLLRQELNLESVNDKIKFLNEIAKILAKIDNSMEREIYVEKISKEYDVSKEAIYAEVYKLTYKDAKDSKILEKAKPVIRHVKREENNVSEKIKRRENTILAILLTGDLNIYQIIKQNISPNDFQYEIDKKIAQKVYEEFEKGNSNINSIIDNLEEEEQNHITMIMAEDYGIENVEKAIDDIIQGYEKDKLNERKYKILELLETEIDNEEKKKLEKELNDIIIKLVKIK